MFIQKRTLILLIGIVGLVLVGGLMHTSISLAAGTYIVNDNANTVDANPGNGICATSGGTCTLHAAIQEANLDGIASLIKFASPMNISFPTLPALTENNTTIDASDRWNGSDDRPGVRMGGGGPLLDIRASGCIVYGIEFVSGGTVGILVGGGGGANTIGGSGPGQRNVFLTGTGVQIQSSGSRNMIRGNYFGTWDGHSPVPGLSGIEVRTNGNSIESNLVGGQSLAGIFIWEGDNNFIQNGNIIGADKLKQAAMPNARGIWLLDSSSNVIKDNFVAGNTSHGIELKRSDDNDVMNNTIGDTFSVGNDGNGIHLTISDNNQLGGDKFGNQIFKNSGYGVWVFGNSNDIQGNGISGNGQDGVRIEPGQDNQIGGGSAALGNSIGQNGANGIHLASGAVSTTVKANFIGLASGAFDGGNLGHGILIEAGASSNQIGGLGVDDGNWIAFNKESGIFITGSATQNNVVEGNVIGAPINWGWPAPNGNHGIGIYNGTHHNWIGIGNTIVSNSWSGIAIVNSDDNIVWFNSIGTRSSGGNWGNNHYGVHLVQSVSNTVFANEIAYNGAGGGKDGVRVDGGLAGNPIQANGIHDSAGAGIVLVNGGNFGLGAPTISQAGCSTQEGGPGKVQGTGCPGCTVELFSDAADEGRFYQGSTTANAATGVFSWTGTITGPNVTATATTSTGATSPFSAPFSTGSCNVSLVFLPMIVR